MSINDNLLIITKLVYYVTAYLWIIQAARKKIKQSAREDFLGKLKLYLAQYTNT